MKFRVKVDLWRRGNHRRGAVVDLPEDEGLSLVNANILEGYSEGTAGVLKELSGTEVPADIPEGTEDTKETPEEALPRPNRSASTEDWAKYAESLGIPAKGHSRAELIALTSE